MSDRDGNITEWEVAELWDPLSDVTEYEVRPAKQRVREALVKFDELSGGVEVSKSWGLSGSPTEHADAFTKAVVSFDLHVDLATQALGYRDCRTASDGYQKASVAYGLVVSHGQWAGDPARQQVVKIYGRLLELREQFEKVCVRYEPTTPDPVDAMLTKTMRRSNRQEKRAELEKPVVSLDRMRRLKKEGEGLEGFEQPRFFSVKLVTQMTGLKQRALARWVHRGVEFGHDWVLVITRGPDEAPRASLLITADAVRHTSMNPTSPINPLYFGDSGGFSGMLLDQASAAPAMVELDRAMEAERSLNGVGATPSPAEWAPDGREWMAKWLPTVGLIPSRFALLWGRTARTYENEWHGPQMVVALDWSEPARDPATLVDKTWRSRCERVWRIVTWVAAGGEPGHDSKTVEVPADDPTGVIAAVEAGLVRFDELSEKFGGLGAASSKTLNLDTGAPPDWGWRGVRYMGRYLKSLGFTNVAGTRTRFMRRGTKARMLVDYHNGDWVMFVDGHDDSTEWYIDPIYGDATNAHRIITEVTNGLVAFDQAEGSSIAGYESA